MSSPSPKKGREGGEGGGGEWKDIQQKTFTRWCNQNLKSRDMNVDSLASDFHDGIKLINLLEVLSKKSLGRYNKKAKIVQQKHENCTACIKFIQSEGMKLVNIGASDIVEGNLKLILGIIWTLILHYQISGLPRFGSDDDSSGNGSADKSASPKQLLLRWIQSQLPERDIKNFTTDWNSGINVAALVEALAPGLCPEWRQMDTSTPLENADMAMTRAEEWLGVPQVLHAQDLINPKIDELSVMTYLSYFPEAKAKEGMPTFGTPKPQKKTASKKKKKQRKEKRKKRKKEKDSKDGGGSHSDDSSAKSSSSSSSSSSSEDEEETDAASAVQTTDFKKFLDERASVNVTKEYAEGGKEMVHVVLGSQACDLDSMVSAMAHAYFNEQVNKSFEQPSSLLLPIFNLPRSNIELRAEAVELFKECHVTANSVTCIDDINLSHLQDEGRLKLTLVDHNVLPPQQRRFIPDVVEILDHHDDQTKDVFDPNLPIWIEPEVGTCATLIAECFLDQMPDALEKNPDLARLLLGVILFKTVNLNPEAGRATERDGEAVEKLVAITGVDRNALFARLQSSLFDSTSTLSAYDLLQRDYRDAAEESSDGMRIGASSMPVSLATFVAKSDASDALEKFVGERDVGLLLLICISLGEGGEPQRQLGVYCRNDGLRQALDSYLTAQETLSLTKVSLELDSCLGYDQGDVRMSRRVVMPMIVTGLSEIAEKGPETGSWVVVTPKEDTRTDFKKFLDDRASVESARQALEGPSERIQVVLGSQTGDLDSVVSALALAYFDEQKSQSRGYTNLTPFPVINAPRSNLELLSDATQLFSDCNVDTVSIPCIDDVNLNVPHSKGTLRLTLVTHNALDINQNDYIPDVVGIIDNHVDETHDVYGSVKKYIEEAGSCATLVAERFLEEMPRALEKNPDLASLLLGVILLETVNLNPDAGRTTTKDRDVAARLGEYADIDAKSLFPQLQSARFNPASGLSAFDLLRRDYRQGVSGDVDVRAGASSIPESLVGFLRRPDAKEALEKFAAKRRLDALLLVCIFFDDELNVPRRQLGIYCRGGDPDLRRDLAQRFETQETLALTRATSTESNTDVFKQGNVRASRRVTLPMIMTFLKERAARTDFKLFVDQRACVTVAKEAALHSDTNELSLVLGSQTGDVDSMVSALAQAYFDEQSVSKTTRYPVFNAPRETICLREDAARLFADCNLDTSSVTCIDDVDLKPSHDHSKLDLTLVTHNALSPDQRHYATDVISIIDNHRDETQDAYEETVEKHIEEAGACATLVAARFLDEMPHALEKNPDLVRLLLGVILLETVNLNPEAGRTTAKDRDIAARLGEYVVFNAESVFPQLQSARFSPSEHLNAYNLLRRDYRDGAVEAPGGVRAGASSITESLSAFLTRPDASDALERFASERDTSLLLLVCIFFDDESRMPRRQLGVYCRDDRLRERAVAYLVEQDLLALSPLTTSLTPIAAFAQGNVKASRKVVLPLLVAGLNEFAAAGKTDFKVFIEERASVSVARERASDPSKDFGVVLGSQACDVDSTVSAVAYAYFLEQTTTKPSYPPFPIFNSQRKDVSLRPDVIKVFTDSNIDLESIPCIDDVDLNSRRSNGGLELSLVAHNVPAPSQTDFIFSPTVIHILDHHDDETADLFPTEVKEMTKTGSTATLIAQKFLKESPNSLAKNPDLTQLLLSAILLETANVRPDAKRATETDGQIVEKLTQLIDRPNYADLESARFFPPDINSAYDLLRRDYKNSASPKLSDTRGGASSIPESVDVFLARPHANEALQRITTEKNVSVLMLNCVWKEKEESVDVKRQLGIYSRDNGDRKKVFDYFVAQTSARLTPVEITAAGRDDDVLVAEQDPTVSRVSLLPMLVEALDQPTPPAAEMQSWVMVQETVPSLPETLPGAAAEEEEEFIDFESFLEERASVRVAKHATNEGAQTVHVVMGNQACDLDSMVSAMAHAYFTFNLTGKPDSSKVALLPYFNIPRSDFPLRVEAAKLFSDCNVHARSKIFLDDVTLKKLHDQRRLQLTLVDHNILNADQTFLASDVIEIIDHHPDMTEGVYGPETACKIELVGSTTTLVAENFLDHIPDVLARNPNLVRLLLSTILLDTANLNPEAGRITAKDGEIAGKLGRLLNDDVNPDDLFKQMHVAKFHPTTLSAYDVLRKDYKFAAKSPETGVRGGTASVTESVDEFLSRSDADAALKRFAEDKGDDVLLLVCLTFENDDPKKPRRYLAVYSPDEALRAKTGKYMTEKGDDLKLSPLKVDVQLPHVATYDQANTKGSRKIIMPTFVEFLKGLNKQEATPPTPTPTPPPEKDEIKSIPEYPAQEELEEERAYKTVTISGKDLQIDLKLIEPYRDVIQHGGYHGPNRMAIIVFAACRLPDKSTRDYEKIMDNLFYYCVSVLETLAADDYMVVYLHGGTPDRNVPKFRWMRRCYPLLDRRIRKSMKKIIMVHCGFWIKTLIRLMRPFISRKFYAKLHFAKTLEHLEAFVDTDQIRIPEPVLEEDAKRGGRPITQAKVKNTDDGAEKVDVL